MLPAELAVLRSVASVIDLVDWLATLNTVVVATLALGMPFSAEDSELAKHALNRLVRHVEHAS